MPFPQSPTLATLERQAQQLTIDSSNTYLVSYPEFLAYFRDLPTINVHHVVIGAHFTYGWMPTILNLGKGDLHQAARLFNHVKVGNRLSATNLQELKVIVNNSTVGLSKLLHFVNPDLYAIWDSHVAGQLLGKPCPQHWISNLALYEDYMRWCQEIVNMPAYRRIHDTVVSQVNAGYAMTPLRTLELLLFWSAKNPKETVPDHSSVTEHSGRSVV